MTLTYLLSKKDMPNPFRPTLIAVADSQACLNIVTNEFKEIIHSDLKWKQNTA